MTISRKRKWEINAYVTTLHAGEMYVCNIHILHTQLRMNSQHTDVVKKVVVYSIKKRSNVSASSEAFLKL